MTTSSPPGFINRALDKTVVLSFGSAGYRRHSKYFADDMSQDLSGKRVLVTGGTAGIGLSVAQTLSGLGANVVITGRNIEKGEQQQTETIRFYPLDMVDWKALKQFCDASDGFDHLVFNAGGMPESLEHNAFDKELQVASQLYGHYIIMKYLRQQNKLKPGARIVWVSSGGMYLQPLDLKNLDSPANYDKVKAYANVKRAQVTLVEELAKDPVWQDYSITAMHPGWVATDGVKGSIPTFYKITKSILRNPAEGADTINWLVASNHAPDSGKFYFDRSAVSPYINSKSNPSDRKRSILLEKLNAAYAEVC